MHPIKVSRVVAHGTRESYLDVQVDRLLFIGEMIFTPGSTEKDFKRDLLGIARDLLDSNLRVYEVMVFTGNIWIKSHDTSTKHFEAIFERLRKKLESSYEVNVVDNIHE